MKKEPSRAQCYRQGYLPDNPARKLTRVQINHGNRTAVFTDEQYQKIIKSLTPTTGARGRNISLRGCFRATTRTKC